MIDTQTVRRPMVEASRPQTTRGSGGRRTKYLLVALLVFTAVTRLALAFRSENRIAQRPYQEDSFYSLNTAMHLAQGDGFSVDGLHPTNGVQPLVVVLFAPEFMIAGSDKWLGVRLTFILGALIDMFAVYAMYRLLRLLTRKRSVNDRDSWARYAPITGAAVWSLTLSFIQYNLNGLETGLYAALILSSAWRYASLKFQEGEGREASLVDWAGFGVILGLMVLARIDGALLVVGFVLTELLTFARERDSKILARGSVFGLFAVLVSSPWWIYNYTVFGSLMPISGQSESLDHYLSLNFATASQTLGDILGVFFYTPFFGNALWYSFAFPVAMAMIVGGLVYVFDLRRAVRSSFDLHPLTPLFIGSGIQLIYYVFFFSAPHFIARYMHPLRVTWLIVVCAALPVLVQRIWNSERSEVRLHLPRTALIVAGAIFVLLISAFNVSRYVLAFTTTETMPAHLFGEWALKHPEERIGMISSGTAAFVSPNVVNLDGKVNFEALKARRAGSLSKYVVDSKLTMIADWPDVVTTIADGAKPYGAEFVPYDSVGPILVLKRIK